MRIVSSELALKIVIALRQSSATLAELVQTLGVQASSCQRALEILVADGLISAVGSGRARRYLAGEQKHALQVIEELAAEAIPSEEALRIVSKANPALEFVCLTETRVLVVFVKRSQPADRSSAEAAIRRLANTLKVRPQFFEREDLDDDRELRARLRHEIFRGRVLFGSVDRSIRDPHRRTAGHLLGHVSPALQLPSQRTLRSIMKRHGVRQLKVFGSAVRSDFRRDSDVDIAVTLDESTGAGPSLEALEVELERRLGHDVDLVLESQLRPPVRYLVEKESVTL